MDRELMVGKEVKGEIRSQKEEEAEISEDVAVLEIVNSIQKRRPASTAGCLLLQGGEQPPTIYRVPKVLRQANEKCYRPQLFSIGPYHHGSEELNPMEEVKFEHLQALLARNPKLELKDCVREIRALEAQARESYADKIGLESEEFVGMMVLDGCFLVEMFIRICITKSQYELWVPYFVSHDMLLLENQLPFCILNRVFCLVAPDQEATSMKDLVLYCLTLIPLVPLNDGAENKAINSYHHLLHLLHHHCLPLPTSDLRRSSVEGSVLSSTKRCLGRATSSAKWRLERVFTVGILCIKRLLNLRAETDEPYGEARMTRSRLMKNPRGPDPLPKSFIIELPKMSSSDQPIPSSIRRSAEELQEAGIEFKRKEWKAGGSFLDVQFNENGVLEIPHFYFSDNLHTTFQNLIAYEQCYPKAPTFFTGYASFMDDIINTAKDIQILRYAGILEHGLGSDEELAGLFNQMNKGVFMDPEKTHLYGECKAINEFCATSWHTYRANLMRNYFYNPWAILSLAAAILLLLLTVTQTVFSIYPNV
ncbi:hypothetical protein ACLOJK_022034 [Asimina triloba]